MSYTKIGAHGLQIIYVNHWKYTCQQERKHRKRNWVSVGWILFLFIFFFFTRVFCFVPWHRNVNVSWINWCWWQFHDWCYMKALWSQYLESGITIESFVSVRILHNHSSNSFKEWMNEWMNGTGEYLEHWLEVTKPLEIFKIC